MTTDNGRRTKSQHPLDDARNGPKRLVELFRILAAGFGQVLAPAARAFDDGGRSLHDFARVEAVG